MKKAIIILSIIFITISVKSQFYSSWTEPMALTDSSSFNSNPELTSTVENTWQSVFMFYEKRQSPEGLSQIWWKEISDTLAEEQLFIEGLPEFDYRNPKVLTNDILVYESNISGNYDLYGVKFDEFGTIGNSFQLTDTEYDETSFFGENYWLPYCCWESNGDIIIADIEYSPQQDSLQFINLITIDSGNCLNPSIVWNFITWRKIEDNESHIYSSSFEWPANEWSGPDTITEANNNINLSVARSNWDGGESFCWESSNKIYLRSKNGTQQEFSPDFSGIDNYHDPTSYNIHFFSKDLPEIYSFVGETNSITNIYIQEANYYYDPIKITNDTLVQKKPRLLTGRHFDGGFDAHNIWQTAINGYDVLFDSYRSYITAGIKEHNNTLLTISPNPVSNNQNIKISSPDNISIYSAQIYSVSGELILKTDFNSKSQQHEIDLKNALPGVYFIKIQTSQGESVKKLIIK